MQTIGNFCFRFIARIKVNAPIITNVMYFFKSTHDQINFIYDQFMPFFLDNQPLADPLSTAELAVLVVGVLLAVLIVICVSLWCYREKQRQKKAGRVSG